MQAAPAQNVIGKLKSFLLKELFVDQHTLRRKKNRSAGKPEIITATTAVEITEATATTVPEKIHSVLVETSVSGETRSATSVAKMGEGGGFPKTVAGEIFIGGDVDTAINIVFNITLIVLGVAFFTYAILMRLKKVSSDGQLPRVIRQLTDSTGLNMSWIYFVCNVHMPESELLMSENCPTDDLNSRVKSYSSASQSSSTFLNKNTPKGSSSPVDITSASLSSSRNQKETKSPEVIRTSSSLPLSSSRKASGKQSTNILGRSIFVAKVLTNPRDLLNPVQAHEENKGVASPLTASSSPTTMLNTPSTASPVSTGFTSLLEKKSIFTAFVEQKVKSILSSQSQNHIHHSSTPFHPENWNQNTPQKSLQTQDYYPESSKPKSNNHQPRKPWFEIKRRTKYSVRDDPFHPDLAKLPVVVCKALDTVDAMWDAGIDTLAWTVGATTVAPALRVAKGVRGIVNGIGESAGWVRRRTLQAGRRTTSTLKRRAGW